MKNVGEEFVWWIGVVEDRNDPLKLGRVRVRVFTLHNKNKGEIPTKDLPWAQPIQDITSAAIGDIGKTPTGMLPGTWVVGFFLDGSAGQRPVVLGTLAGIPTQLGSEVDYTREGFSDPAGIYPYRKEEPDVNRLARGDEPHIIESGLQSEAVSSVPIALQTTTWSQPPYNNQAEYPFNHVIETESGHVTERDDTPGSEKTLDLHRVGTYTYVDENGNRNIHVRANNYEVIASDNNVLINGSCNVTIRGDYNLLVKGDMNVQVEGNYNLGVGGSTVENHGSAEYSYSSKTASIGSKTETVGSENLSIGSSVRTYNGVQDVRNEGDVYTFTGADTYSRHEDGTDYSCPTDPVRQSDIACSEIKVASPGSVSTLTFATGDVEVINGVLVYRDPYDPINTTPIVNAVFGDTTPSLIELAALTVLDSESDSTPANTTISCTSFGATLSASDYSSYISPNYKLEDLSIRALFPHKIRAQNNLTEGQIACNLQALAINVLEPIRARYGTSFRINSGFRQFRNGRSDHEYGQAVDIQFPGYSRAQTLEVAKWVRDNIPSYKQVIFENMGNAGGWVHVAYAGSRGSNDKIVLSTRNGRSYQSGLII